MGGDCRGHDAPRGGGGEQTWRAAAEPEAEAESEAEVELGSQVGSQVGSQAEIEIESESGIQIERQGQRWVKTWWIERRRKGG